MIFQWKIAYFQQKDKAWNANVIRLYCCKTMPSAMLSIRNGGENSEKSSTPEYWTARTVQRLLQYMRLSALFSSLAIINVSIIGMLFDHNCRHLKYFLFSQFRSGFVIQSVRLLHGVSGSVCYVYLLRCAGSPWDCCFWLQSLRVCSTSTFLVRSPRFCSLGLEIYEH